MPKRLVRVLSVVWMLCVAAPTYADWSDDFSEDPPVIVATGRNSAALNQDSAAALYTVENGANVAAFGWVPEGYITMVSGHNNPRGFGYLVDAGPDPGQIAPGTYEFTANMTWEANSHGTLVDVYVLSGSWTVGFRGGPADSSEEGIRAVVGGTNDEALAMKVGSLFFPDGTPSTEASPVDVTIPNVVVTEGSRVLMFFYYIALSGDGLRVNSMALNSAGPKTLAGAPLPPNRSTDVGRASVALAWSSGETAVSHDVFFGTDFEDVNTATATTDPTSVYQGNQTDASFDPRPLAFGETYYWRVDEVNAAPDFTVFQGDVWSFTTEPVSIPISGVTTTASSSFGASVAENTLNGSGLVDDLHGIVATDMWISAGIPATIDYAFDRVYKLHELWIWNSNQSIEPFIGFGAKDVVIEHSLDGENWTVLAGVGPLAQAPGTVGYAHNNTIGFGGVTAQHVRVTINSVHGFAPQASLSEVRFFSIPTLATRPSPDSGATNVAPDLLLSWGRNGREADSHDVYIGTDANDLSLAGRVMESSFDTLPSDLQLGQTYHWQVVEVNDATDPSQWAGAIWSFTTTESIVVDDMESYKDEEFLEIWATWVDGFDDPANNGSLVGNGVTGSPETDIVHGGRQSLPLNYGNGDVFQSQATRTFASAQDWSGHGIRSLSLAFHGSGDNGAGQLYVMINNTRVNYSGLADALQRPQWMLFNINLAASGADLTNITSLTVGLEGGGAGVLYVDDIRLYPSVPQTVEPVVPDENDPNLVAYYEFEGNANDTMGNYHGTAEGEPTYAAGKTGQAMVFDGIDDHVVNTFDQEVVWPAYSVSLWVKTDAFSQQVNNSPFNNNSSSSDFQIDVDGTNPGNYRYQGSASVILGAVVDEWVQLAASCDGTSTSVYYNGLLIETVDLADNRFGQIAIGINRNGTSPFQGMIDDVRVYDRALSHGEVAGSAGITDTIPVPF